jgi:hypothetical protein
MIPLVPARDPHEDHVQARRAREATMARIALTAGVGLPLALAAFSQMPSGHIESQPSTPDDLPPWARPDEWQIA